MTQKQCQPCAAVLFMDLSTVDFDHYQECRNIASSTCIAENYQDANSASKLELHSLFYSEILRFLLGSKSMFLLTYSFRNLGQDQSYSLK